MSSLREWLAGGLMISDGAWGTQLQVRGLASGTTPDTWNLTHAEQVESVARASVEAGSQVILTNTFRANAVAMHSSTETELDAINRAEFSLRAAVHGNSVGAKSVCQDHLAACFHGSAGHRFHLLGVRQVPRVRRRPGSQSAYLQLCSPGAIGYHQAASQPLPQAAHADLQMSCMGGLAFQSLLFVNSLNRFKSSIDNSAYLFG